MVVSVAISRYPARSSQIAALLLSSLAPLVSGCWKVNVEPDVEPIMIEFHQTGISPSNGDRGLSVFLYTFPDSTKTMVRMSRSDSLRNKGEEFFVTDRARIVKLVRELGSIGLFSLRTKGDGPIAVVDYDRRTNITVFCGETHWGNSQPFSGCLAFPISQPTQEEASTFSRSAALVRATLESLPHLRVFSNESPEAKVMDMWLVERLRGHPFDSASAKRRQRDSKRREQHDEYR